MNTQKSFEYPSLEGRTNNCHLMLFDEYLLAIYCYEPIMKIFHKVYNKWIQTVRMPGKHGMNLRCFKLRNARSFAVLFYDIRNNEAHLRFYALSRSCETLALQKTVRLQRHDDYYFASIYRQLLATYEPERDCFYVLYPDKSIYETPADGGDSVLIGQLDLLDQWPEHMMFHDTVLYVVLEVIVSSQLHLHALDVRQPLSRPQRTVLGEFEELVPKTCSDRQLLLLCYQLYVDVFDVTAPTVVKYRMDIACFDLDLECRGRIFNSYTLWVKCVYFQLLQNGELVLLTQIPEPEAYGFADEIRPRTVTFLKQPFPRRTGTSFCSHVYAGENEEGTRSFATWNDHHVPRQTPLHTTKSGVSREDEKRNRSIFAKTHNALPK